MDSDRKHWVSVAAAIIDGDRVLVTRRRDNGKWEPPGGGLDPQEPILDGLIREVKEEIGLEVVPGELTGVYKNMQRGIVALVFRCEYNGQPIKTSEEVDETVWMAAEEIEQRLDPAYSCRLLDALNQGPVAIRIHDGVRLL
jgi:8-oxo-dGTP diphosphatase